MTFYGNWMEMVKINAQEGHTPEKDSTKLPTSGTLLNEYITRGKPNLAGYPHSFGFTVIT